MSKGEPTTYTSHGVKTQNDLRSIEENNDEYLKNYTGYEYAAIAPRKFTDTTVEVTKDSTGKSETDGQLNDYRDLFVDRLQKLRKIVSQHKFDSPMRKLKDLPNSEGHDVTVCGLIRVIRDTQKGNKLIVLDDETGDFPIVFTDEELFEQMDTMIEDEVVAISGQVSNDGNIMFGNELFSPEIPFGRNSATADRNVKAVFLSDIHVGSDKFAFDRWNEFVDWVRKEEDISYVITAGDLVEGVGIFPDQEDELELTKLDDQYKFCGELFSKFPDDVEIITTVGNHDAIRLAEPQPTLPQKYTKYFPENVTWVSNPASVSIENGVSIELYHGASIHDFTSEIPGLDEDNPTGPMEHMLKKRHLAPLFGNNARIAPEVEDYHVIKTIPSIFHTGHVHTYETDTYHDILMLNTGGWVYQTSYQERMNIQPTVGRITVVNLNTLKHQNIQFGQD